MNFWVRGGKPGETTAERDRRWLEATERWRHSEPRQWTHLETWFAGRLATVLHERERRRTKQ